MARAGREDLEALRPLPRPRLPRRPRHPEGGLTVEWASEHFPDHQVAIVYHDDNEGRIPHAHVVVNNTSLETGRRLQVPDPLELNRSFQQLEAERGPLA